MNHKPGTLLSAADVVHQLRAYIGFDLNQNELAAKIGTHPTYLSGILTGKRAPNKATLEFLGLRKVTCYEKVD